MDKKTRELYEKYGINPEECEIENRKIIEERYNNIDSENKAFLDSLFKKALEENFEHFKHYLHNPRFYYFTDLKSTIGEIVKCLITESHTAAITLTNNFSRKNIKISINSKSFGDTT